MKIQRWPPPPPPSLWRVTTPSGELDVRATYCARTQKGTLLFKDEDDQLVRGFVETKWLLVEKIIGDTPAD